MSEYALLPPGVQDNLTEDTRLKQHITQQLQHVFFSMGYNPVTPPLVEFEQSLFAGSGAALEQQTFRVLDPLSQKMVGIRSDMTMQIARIAASRLQQHPLPLRLSYCGDIMRVNGEGLEAKRQLTQAGIECIGTRSTTADKEVLAISIEALYQLGITDISVDFTVPHLVSKLVDNSGLSADITEKLYYALEKKDVASIRALGGELADLLVMLTETTSIDHIDAIIDALPSKAYQDICLSLQKVVTKIREVFPAITITLDFIEYRGYEYHSGVCFSLFSTEHNVEVGRGGRYLIAHTDNPAVGCSLYVDTLMNILTPPDAPQKIYIPLGTSMHDTKHLREQGYITIHATAKKPAEEQALLHGCSFVYIDGKIKEI